MKCLIAVKPCGCPEDMIRHWPENIAIIAWREYHEGTGCKVLEGEPPELILPFCPHGSLPAQLAAKLREAEAREAGLKEWLMSRAADSDRIYDDRVGDAFREVLAKLEARVTA